MTHLMACKSPIAPLPADALAVSYAKLPAHPGATSGWGGVGNRRDSVTSRRSSFGGTDTTGHLLDMDMDEPLEGLDFQAGFFWRRPRRVCFNLSCCCLPEGAPKTTGDLRTNMRVFSLQDSPGGVDHFPSPGVPAGADGNTGNLLALQPEDFGGASLDEAMQRLRGSQQVAPLCMCPRKRRLRCLENTSQPVDMHNGDACLRCIPRSASAWVLQ